MRNPLLFSLKTAVFFSISVAAAAAATSSSFALSSSSKKSKTQCLSSSNSYVPKATARDLIALLGSPDQASSVNTEVAKRLTDCFKFLVPFSPHVSSQSQVQFSASRQFLRSIDSTNDRSQVGVSGDKYNEMIWWPPAPVMELARLAIDSGGDPGAIYWTIDPTVIQVPDVEGSTKVRCQLTRTPYGRRFMNEELNSYLEQLFKIIVDRGPSVGLNVSLNRYDLFHGHIFLAKGSGRLGILFHAKEYPAFDKELFPFHLGYCQKGSNVAYDDLMNLRNILWLAPLPKSSKDGLSAPGVFVVLDAHPKGIIYQDLIPEYVDFVRTLYEEDFGEVVADVNYLNVGTEEPKFEIFIC